MIGAGILGTSSAYHLLRHRNDKEEKKRILLVDALPAAAQGNTARSNAMFRNTFSSIDNQILCDASINYYLDLQESGVDIGLRKTGYLWLMSGRQLSSSQNSFEKMTHNGIDIKRYDKREIERTIPELRTTFRDEEASLMHLEDIDGAMFGPKCGRLDPDKLANHYLDEFLKLGGNVAFNTSADRLLVEPDNPIGIEGEPFVWQEEDSQVAGAHLSGQISGNVRARTVVIACGAWINQLLEPIGVDGHVKAKKRQLFKIPARDQLEPFLHNPNFNELKVLPFVILPKSGCFVKAIAENKEFWVGCDDDFGREYINNPSRDHDQDYKAEPSYYSKHIHPILRNYLPHFEGANPSQMWAGLYSYNTIDYIPFVFKERGMIVVGGDSGSGIMKADSLGRIVDSVYRLEDDAEVELHGGRKYAADRLGFKKRRVEREEWML